MKYYVRKKLLNLKGSKLGQTLCAGKTGFRRLGHIFRAVPICKITDIPITNILAMKITDSDTNTDISIHQLFGTITVSYTDNFIYTN